MKLTGLLEKRTDDASDKQFLVGLHKAGKIGHAVLRAMAQRLDALKAAGKTNALRLVAEEYDSGKIAAVEEAKKADVGPVLAEANPNDSPKQQIVWLFQNGSISQEQLRKAAAVLDRMKTEGEELDVALALAHAGAVHVLSAEEAERVLRKTGHGETVDAVKKAVDKAVKRASGKKSPEKEPEGEKEPEAEPETEEPEGDKTPAETEGDGGEQGDDGTGDEQTEQTKAERAAAKLAAMSTEQLAEVVHSANAAPIIEAVRATKDIEFLSRLHAIERAHPSYSGGRKGVLDAIEERKGELITPNANEG